MKRYLSLLALAAIALASPLWAADFAPHPACLDIDLRQSVRDGFLVAPLRLSDCGPRGKRASPYNNLGFSSYDRPRDAAGTPTGSVGYQRIAGNDGEVLYVLRVHGGGSGVFTELLVGRERHGASGAMLIDGRVHGLSPECDGLVDAWTEPNGRIRMVLNLSPAAVLQALVAPRGQPPSAVRDGLTLQALFGERALSVGGAAARTCPGFAEYELDPGLLEWRLDSLRLDIRDDADEDALLTLIKRVPGLDADGVAMLLGDDLKAVRASLLGRLQRPQLPPRDDTARDADFAAFSAALHGIVRKRDVEALIGMTLPEVMLGFGGSGGHADLRERLRNPATAAGYWRDLGRMLQLGSVRMGADTFCAPYPGCIDLKARDPHSVLVVIRPRTPLLERPDPRARSLRMLDLDIVQLFDQFGEGNGRFSRVRLFDGEVGYIDSAALRSPLDLRMEVVRSPGGWRIRSIVEGD
ncbi:MAG: hypothetical protein Q8M53_14180 [Burkholderiales bacterium]|nr:hypothetical protein [Burkholderiales bacterium]